MSKPRERVKIAGFRLGWGAVRRLPPRRAYRLFDALADVTYRRDGNGVRRMRANYARVRPELGPAKLETLVRDGMRSYFRYWCEAFRLPDRDAVELGAAVRVEGDAPVRADLGAGRGVACFLGHLGNWDTAGAWSTTHLAPVTTVVERLDPEAVFEQFLAFRERLGMTIIPLSGGGTVFDRLAAAARAGALVPLLADRDLTSTGVGVDFCGHRARMAVGPAALAVATGVALYPVSTRYEPAPEHPSGHHLVITFHDRVPDPGPEVMTESERVAVMTQACADALGGVVRAYTEDWHMMQRVFEADLHLARSSPGPVAG